MTTRVNNQKSVSVDIFYNPSAAEIKDIKETYDTIKAIILPNGDFIVWSHHAFHHGDIEHKLGIDADSAARITFGYDYVTFYSRNTGDRYDGDHNNRTAEMIFNNSYVRKFVRGEPNVVDQSGNVWPSMIVTEKVMDQIHSNGRNQPIFLNPTIAEFRTLLHNLREDTDWRTDQIIPGTMRGLLIPSTQDVLIWDGWYAPHGYITDRFNFKNGFHLILTADKITVLTLWRYERAGFDREAVEELVRANPYLKRMYRNQVEIVIET